jgi:hypothetical protein
MTTIRFPVTIQIADGIEATFRCGADFADIDGRGLVAELWTDEVTQACRAALLYAGDTRDLIEMAYEALAQQREADEARDEDARHHY